MLVVGCAVFVIGDVAFILWDVVLAIGYTVKHGLVEFLKPDLVELLKPQKESKKFEPFTKLQKQSNLQFHRNSRIFDYLRYLIS